MVSGSRVLVVVCGALALVIAAVSAQQAPPAAGAGRGAADTRVPAGSVEHGRYIVERVAMCVECHSPRDEQGNIVAREQLMGGGIVPPGPRWAQGWATRTPRIAGLPAYSDDLAIRLLTQGAIGRDGRQLKLPMPRFRMSPQDAADVIAYLKSI